MEKLFGESLKEWLAVQSLGRKNATVTFYRYADKRIRKHWPNPNQPVKKISTKDVLEFAQKVSHLSPSMWNTIVCALRYITPAAKVLKRRPMKIRDFIPPTQMQFAALLTECDSSERSQAGLIVRFLSLTGMRIGEARALTWENVFDDRIEVRSRTTKNGRTRSIPRIDGLSDVLNRLRALDSGKYVLPRQCARKAIKNACKRARIPLLSYHCFRHYFATKCIEAGVDTPTVSRWLGHSDGGALLSKTYFHLMDRHSREMAARVRIAA